MVKTGHLKFICSLILLTVSCEKMTFVIEADASENRTFENEPPKPEDDGLFSEQRFRHPSVSEEAYIGAMNAVKKAYQLTDIVYEPLMPIFINTGFYRSNVPHKGMIYSSVKEIGTFVGSNVSFHTFMTAVHNPRSKLYTERINESPYNGTNCRAYYGTVCNGLVSYALGLMPIYGSYDFPASDEMMELDYSDIDSFHIGDILWISGHVALITDVIRDEQGSVLSIEISEAVQSGCTRYSISKGGFKESVSKLFKRIFRYKYLEANVNYTASPEFIPVLDEEPVSFTYNDDLCVDKGDRSCYFVGEDVVINLLSQGDSLEIYKDDVLLSVIKDVSEDVRLSELEYGTYKARLAKGDVYSDYTFWIMVDCSIIPSKEENSIHFSSRNSSPLFIYFGAKTGGRGVPMTETLCRSFDEQEVFDGSISLAGEKVSPKSPFFVITFATEYGNISTRPIKWFN